MFSGNRGAYDHSYSLDEGDGKVLSEATPVDQPERRL
jgi:hypothetical protein